MSDPWLVVSVTIIISGAAIVGVLALLCIVGNQLIIKGEEDEE